MLHGIQATQLSTTPYYPAGFTWTKIGGVTVAMISGGMPDPREWRDFLDHLRPCVRPVVVWVRGRIWFDAAGRTELAQAIGTSRVALVVDDDLGRGLGTALRWLGVDLRTYARTELEQLETDFDLPAELSDTFFEQLV